MFRKLVGVVFKLRQKNAEPVVIHQINNGYLLGFTYYETELEVLNALVAETSKQCDFKGSYATYDSGTMSLDFTTGAMAEEEDTATSPGVDMMEVKVTEDGVLEVTDIVPAEKHLGRACGNCGEYGHNKRSCTKDAAPRTAKYKTKDIGPTPGLVTKDKEPEADWYYHDILDMLRDGLNEQEIYQKVYMSITDTQFRVAMEWAKEQLD
jgi:hypothetical protein